MSELHNEDADALFARLEQDYANEHTMDLMKVLYGVEHNCRCGEDIEEGNIEEVPRCYLDMTDQAFRVLKRHRAFLSGIATSPSEDADTLKAMAEEALLG